MKLLAISVLIAGFAISSQAQELTARFVAYRDCHPDAANLAFLVRPSQCGPFNQGITFLIEGRNIAVVDKNSLVVSSLEIKGNDARFNRKGDAAYRATPTPKVNESGTQATFSVFLESAPFGSIAAMSLTGSVDVITSGKLIIEERTGLNIDTPFTVTTGPLSFSNKRSSKVPKLPSSFSDEQKARYEARKLEVEAKYLRLFVTGNFDAYVEAQIFVDGREIKRETTSLGPKERTINFPRPAGSVIDLKIRYWDGLKRSTVTLEM